MRESPDIDVRLVVRHAGKDHDLRNQEERKKCIAVEKEDHGGVGCST